MLKKVLVVDMDDVLAELVPKWVAAVNEGERESVSPADVVSWDIDSYFKCGKKVYEYLTYDLYRNLPVSPDSVDVLRKLQGKFDVYVVTSATAYTESLVAKVEWLEEHFPFIDRSHIVLCGNKNIIKADVMIDDGVHNLESFDGTHLLFDAPHNRNNRNFTRVYSWKQIENLLL